MLKLFKKPTFYLWFVLVFAAIILFRDQEVFGFRRFPVNSALDAKNLWEMKYIYKKDINDLILWITYTSMKVAKNQINIDVTNIKVDDVEDLMKLKIKLESLARTSLQSLINTADNGWLNLELYYKSLTKTLNQAKLVIPSLVNLVKQYEISYRTCYINQQNAKELYDKWLKNWQDWYVEWAYKDWVLYKECLDRQKENLDIYKPLLDQIYNYYKQVKQKKNQLQQYILSQKYKIQQ